MRCISWRTVKSSAATRSAAALLAAALGAAAAAGPVNAEPASAQPPKHVDIIDDADTGQALLGRFDYVGRWQHVRGKHDGRTNGTSTRSTATGDTVILGFRGTRVRIFGVKGPSGGRAGIALDQKTVGVRPFDFYSPRIQTHALIYESPVLPDAVHVVSVVVWGTRNARGHYYYVNIDGAEVEN